MVHCPRCWDGIVVPNGFEGTIECKACGSWYRIYQTKGGEPYTLPYYTKGERRRMHREAVEVRKQLRSGQPVHVEPFKLQQGKNTNAGKSQGGLIKRRCIKCGSSPAYGKSDYCWECFKEQRQA